MIDHIVVDVEIQKCVGDGGLTWDDTDRMGVACCCLWSVETQRMSVYGPTDMDDLKERLALADRISGFGIVGFDLPVIFGLKNRQRVHDLDGKADDLLRRIWDALGEEDKRGWNLDNVARGTLGGPGKIAHGSEAPRWFQSGEWGKLITYCCDDVALERDLTTFVDRYGYVVNGATGRKLAIPAWNGGC